MMHFYIKNRTESSVDSLACFLLFQWDCNFSFLDTFIWTAPLLSESEAKLKTQIGKNPVFLNQILSVLIK